MSDAERVRQFQKIDLETARSFCEDHPDFDDDFISSLERYFEKAGELTPKQHAALTNIIEKWDM